jgi:hypothetical protein
MAELIKFSKITLQDLTVIQKIALENGGSKTINKSNFTHWYLENPTASNSILKVEVDNTIEGYATTNNFVYTLDNKNYLVALPQNVLTTEKCRGKGLFGKLYYLTEKENIETNHVDFFLTSTNSLSTPIFLSKFGYLRGFCPPILIKLFSPFSLFSKVNYKPVDDLTSIKINHFNLNNSRKKNMNYFQWRYSQTNKKNLKVISVIDNNQTIGYAFLIAQIKKGFRVLMLADIICSNEKFYSKIIKACHTYASKNFYVGFLMFELQNENINHGSNIKLKNKFNFLVKGKCDDETKKLSQIKFNYFFGDLDYFW